MRIKCFFVDLNHRRRGVAEVALTGALDLMAIADEITDSVDDDGPLVSFTEHGLV